MFASLLKKEIRNIFKSITFYILILVVGFFCYEQFDEPYIPKAPITQSEAKQTGIQVNYGNKKITEPKKEIRAVYLELYDSYEQGFVYKVRIMLNTRANLSNEEKYYIKEAMEKIAPEEYLNNDNENLIKVSYDEYLNIIKDLDKKLGGSTQYNEKNIKDMGILNESRTYEEAVEDYNNIINEDKITNAVARYYSDYMGITAGLFPIFLSAFILMKDKRNKMEELICSRSISSCTYILSKYLALCICVFIPYLLIATYSTIGYYNLAKINNCTIDMLAFYKYSMFWILPTICFTNAMGMIISIIFRNGIPAIFIQFILWIATMMPLKGDYSLSRFMIRFNTLGHYSEYINWVNSIVINRIFYVIISFVLIFIACFIWSKKRGTIGERIK